VEGMSSPAFRSPLHAQLEVAQRL